MRFGRSESAGPSNRAARAAALSSRLVLLAGFGGLLLLMSFAGFDSIRTLGQIQKSNDDIREDFLLRTRVLEQIRADVYVSGTYVRDYVLEPEAEKAESHRMSLFETRSDMDAALGRYRALLAKPELGPFHSLTEELNAYWKLLEPVLLWDATERRQNGYTFLRDEVFPRRTAMLNIADQIAGINESQLNAGRERVVETFSRFRQRLVVTIGLTVGMGLLLAAFCMGKILALEAESAARYQEISTARAELKQLSARLVEAQENERRSISRELHDAVGQTLTGIRVELANLSRTIRNQQMDGLEIKVDEIKEMVDDSVGVVRNMALLLRPSMLDDLGLVPALQWQAREVSKRTGVRVKVAAEGVSEDLPEDHKTCVYRIVQEALHNCVQHSEASLVRVTVEQNPNRILLVIQDDGKGFDPQFERGMGLLGMQERVSHLGGTFSVESQPGTGAILCIVLPLAKPVEEQLQHSHGRHPNSVS
jgi:signal transduction histidine kinase